MRFIWRQCTAIAIAKTLRALTLGFVATFILFPIAGMARTDPALLCDQAATRVAVEANLPLDVLRAITRTETGRGALDQMKPWPWTVNMEGKGVWFDTVDQAQVYVFRHFKEGARSFDVGCFQINYKWHGHAFNSIEDMFDPVLNARYAAQFLKQLYAEHGDWSKAVGAYHSRTQKYAQRYLRKYAKIRESLPDPKNSPAVTAINGFPLLVGRSSQKSSGSLFPSATGARAGSLHPGLGG